MPEGARKLLTSIHITETVLKGADGGEQKINRTKRVKWHSLMGGIRELNRMMGFHAPTNVKSENQNNNLDMRTHCFTRALNPNHRQIAKDKGLRLNMAL